MWTKLFLLTGFLNALLKATPDGDLTVFRVLLPIAAIVLLFRNGIYAAKYLTLVAALLICQIISQLVSGYPVSYLQFAFLGNYLTMFFMYFVVQHEIDNGQKGLYRFLAIAYVVTVAGLALQFLTGYQLPNINDAEGRLNAWYWNENDASLALAAFLILSIRQGFSARMLPVHLIAIAIIQFNGARASLWGVIAFAAIWVLTVPGRLRSGSAKAAGLTLVTVGVVGVAGTLFLYPEVVMDGASGVAETIGRVVSLQDDPTDPSSIGSRTNATVYAIREFIDSYGLGIGAGNSIAMLQTGKYPVQEIYASIHNMPLQMLLELGFPFMFALLIAVWRGSRLPTRDFLLVLAVYAFISLGQSGGFLANFFAMACFYAAISASSDRGGRVGARSYSSSQLLPFAVRSSPRQEIGSGYGDV